MVKRLQEQRGFTLIEMMVVLAIIALIAVFAIPSIQRALQNSRIKTVEAQGRQIQNAFDQYFNDNVYYPKLAYSADTTYADLFGSPSGALRLYVSLPDTEDGSMFAIGGYTYDNTSGSEHYELILHVRNVETGADKVYVTETSVTRQ